MWAMKYFRMLILAMTLTPLPCSAISIQSMRGYPTWNTSRPLPFYFSGTNCRAFFRVSASSNMGSRGLANIYMRIGGEQVGYWHFEIMDPNNPMSVGTVGYVPYRFFDSTHLSNGTVTVECEATAYLANGQESEPEIGSFSTQVKNRGLAYEHADPGITPDPAPYIAARLAEMNYTTSVATEPWNAQTYLFDMANSNVSSYSGHGSPHSHVDGILLSQPYNTIWNGGAGTPGNPQYSYLNWRQMQVGSDALPPFNSSANPPLNFLFVQCCRAGQDPDWKRALFPERNAYNQDANLSENQAVWAWVPYISMGDMKVTSMVIWPKLAAGKAVGASLIEFGQYLINNPSSFTVWDTYPGPSRHMVWTDAVMFGDPATRLRTLYTGTTIPPVNNWYQQP